MQEQYKNKWVSKLSQEEVVLLLQSLLTCPEVHSFCTWIEDTLFSHIFPQTSIKEIIQSLSSHNMSEDAPKLNNSIPVPCPAAIDTIKKILKENPENFFHTLLEFMFKPNVLMFYRRITELLRPVIELDIITLTKAVDKNSLSPELLKLLELFIKQEFTLYAEKFVVSWYDQGDQSFEAIHGVPFGELAEYDLFDYIIMNLSEHAYWDSGVSR